jgi:CRISPR-associated protein Cmr3
MTNTLQGFALEPLDTLLFRDGRPFDQSDEGLTETRSLFPPFPSIAAAALRARLARDKGWSGRGDWDKTITDVLGSGPFDAGGCRFGPPIVMAASPGVDYSAYFPCPAAIVGRTDPEDRGRLKLAVLKPQSSPARLATDLGLKPSQLFCSVPNGYEPLDHYLINATGLRTFLGGADPDGDNCKHLDTLFKRQDRAGIKRDYATHGAAESMLYTASHVRPMQGRVTRHGKVAIGVRAKLPDHEGKPLLLNPAPYYRSGRWGGRHRACQSTPASST